MQSKYCLGLSDARGIADAALRYAEEKGWKVSVAVVDEGGYPILSFRMDGIGAHTSEIALQKARSAAVTQRPTKFWEERIAEGRLAVLKMPVVFPMEGGEPILYQGQCIGGIGVSGARSFEDAEVARAGAAAIA